MVDVAHTSDAAGAGSTDGGRADVPHQRSRGPRGRGRGRGKGRGGAEVAAGGARDDAEGSTSNAAHDLHPSRGKGGPRRGNRGAGRGQSVSHDTSPREQINGDGPAVVGRRRKFAGKLTDANGEPGAEQKAEQKKETAQIITEYNDLRSRLVAELSSGAYDCLVCYSCVTTRSPIWSCSQCHSVLHLNCAQKWAESSVAKVEEQNSRQEDPAIRNRRGTWRCPGCQLAREDVPRKYLCWDGQQVDPVGGKGSPPHSCGRPCSKGKCVHGCSAGLCHPGPCPPCPISITRGCFCGSQQITLRCSQLRSTNSQPVASVSCGQKCGKPLNCESHACSKICHDGPCGGCEETISAQCYCGRHFKNMRCGEGVPRQSCKAEVESWTGRWSCESTCARLYSCQKHACQRSCHAPDQEQAICPLSPELVTTCPCGAKEINAGRTSCEAEIKTCGQTCNRQLTCGHSCESLCHLGKCPPCKIFMSTPCRCGETKKQLPCYEKQREEQEGGQEVLCQTICRSLRLCGRHECRRRCCPLYFQAKSKSKRKPTYEELIEQDPAGLHACDVSCGKLLRCGTHHCEMNCHRGACPPCLQASFDELSCHCGRTVMDPPVPCGTIIHCHFPCTRPSPPCGHPKQQHDCHETEQCPPCIYLVDKVCICGKNTVPNIPCHRNRISCGYTCDAVLNCGFHRCQKSCHDVSQCEKCQQTCTKPRKCGHPCPEPCHAPSACPETSPCQAWVTLLCACGHQQQQVRCGHSIHSPLSNDRTLKCNDACLIAQRNAKLADALGLNPSVKSQPTEYLPGTLGFFASNRRYADEVENTLIEFIKSHKHAIIFAPPSPTQRGFIHELVAVYGLQSEDVDEEPKRSVAVRRGMHAKIPNPLLEEAYNQYKSSQSRLRPMAVGQLKREEPRSSSPVVNMNALLLKGVFGVEERSLNSILRKVTSNSPIHLTWLNEEDVVAIVSNSSTLKLRVWAQEIRNMGHLDAGYSRIAKEVNVCYCNESGKVVQVDSPSSLSSNMGRNASAPGSSSASRIVGAWATVAAGHSAAPSPSPAQAPTPRLNPNATAWVSSSRPVNSTASNATITRSNRASPHQPSIPIPDQWDT